MIKVKEKIHMRKNKWNSDSCEREALKYKSRADFKRGSGSAYKAARKLGIIDKICSHMENMAGVRTMTKDQLIFVSKTFNNIKDLNNNNRGIYRAILNRGLEKVAFEHMENGGYTCYPWTDEELRQEALKYEYRADFMKYGSKAYYVAARRSMLDDICKHMKPSLTSSLPEREMQ